LPLWWFALDWIAWVGASAADLIYHFFDPRMSIVSEGKIVRVAVQIPEEFTAAQRTQEAALRTDLVTYGMPMLAALIAVTRSESWARKGRALAIGLGAMLVVTVPVVMLWAKLASLQLDQRIAEAGGFSAGERSGFAFYVFHGYAFSQPVIAVGIWIALLALGAFKKGPSIHAREAPNMRPQIARNRACYCGSGRKFKRCCGKR
jgi:hypothetical protein